MTPGGHRASREQRGLAAILKRFPEDSAALQLLFQASHHFEALCGDYWDGLSALQRWERSTSEEAPAMCSMYTVLLQELEQEVREYRKSGTAAPNYPGDVSGRS
jgi:hypothetical protein